jgi:hypothetical protein
MAGKRFRVKKQPPTPAQQFAVFREEVRKSQQRVADKHVERREAVPSNRNGRFEFEGEAVAQGTVISIRVILKNAAESLGRYGKTVGDIWEYLNRGTGRYGPYKQHYAIYPRFKKALRFVVNGAVVFARYVFNEEDKTHPGMKPRRYTEKINKSLQPFEKKETAKGFRAAWKKLEKFNKRK